MTLTVYAVQSWTIFIMQVVMLVHWCANFEKVPSADWMLG